jgi:hypothetical protein
MADEDVHLPLSGNVMQSFFPLTINVGRSGSQDTEKDALTIASYGRQLGRISEALLVLLENVALKRTLSSKEVEAITDFKCMVRGIAKLKTARDRELVLTPQTAEGRMGAIVGSAVRK